MEKVTCAVKYSAVEKETKRVWREEGRALSTTVSSRRYASRGCKGYRQSAFLNIQSGRDVRAEFQCA